MQELIIIVQVAARAIILENNFHEKVLLLFFAKFVALKKGALRY